MISPNYDSAGAACEPTDEELMQEITDRNPKALAALYRRHGERLRSVISNVVHEPADADDVLQEILLQIWKEAANYSAKAGRPLGWIVTLARRRAIDRLRRCQAYSRAKDRFTEQLDVRLPSTSPRRSSDEFARADLRTFLERHIQALPAFQGQAIRLAFFNGLSHREIAAATDTPLGTVKTRLELGLQKLTQCMTPLRRKI
jgi:RNA polymerase sigma-70 factor (ECF subfamily)